MALDQKTTKRLDDAAKSARVDFESNWDHWSARDVAVWWNKWCTMDGTNHDRLGRILMDVTGVRPAYKGPKVVPVPDGFDL